LSETWTVGIVVAVVAVYGVIMACGIVFLRRRQRRSQ
jgi:hypothetical protein